MDSLTEMVLETVMVDDDDLVIVVVRVKEEESSFRDDLIGFPLLKPGMYKHRALHLNPSSNVLLLLMLLFDSVLMKKEFLIPLLLRESLLLVDPQDLLLLYDAEDESCSLFLSDRKRPERCLGEAAVEFGRLRLPDLVCTGCNGRGIGASKSLGGDIAGKRIISKLSFLLIEPDIDNDLIDFGSIDISLSDCIILVCLTRIFFFESFLLRTCQSSRVLSSLKLTVGIRTAAAILFYDLKCQLVRRENDKWLSIKDKEMKDTYTESQRVSMDCTFGGLWWLH